jgi:hypothetical protein
MELQLGGEKGMKRRVIFLYRWPVEELVEGKRTRVATSVVVLF